MKNEVDILLAHRLKLHERRLEAIASMDGADDKKRDRLFIDIENLSIKINDIDSLLYSVIDFNPDGPWKQGK